MATAYTLPLVHWADAQLSVLSSHKQRDALRTIWFWFSPIDDTLAEDSETISISGTATKFPVSGYSISLEDDEALKLTLSHRVIQLEETFAWSES